MAITDLKHMLGSKGFDLDMIKEELLKSPSPAQFLSDHKLNMDIDHLKIERQKAMTMIQQQQMQAEAGRMAMHHMTGGLSPDMRDMAGRILRNEFTEIYENPQYHREFDDRFKH